MHSDSAKSIKLQKSK